ncbi:helix-turn-helix domain-containing protein [Sporosarcina sp. D27]|uniref:helix-turn-helix domain-containing protein n=1 Tax=Sporosarcina sp. D27 TaxID=1382305 RepID=UPI0004AD82F0|nr:helix-turn-helix domain-containing protein [Sporosarcina sp. D27]
MEPFTMNYLAEYQTFESKNELNDAIDIHIERNNFALNETERSIFLMLSRYAVKFPGVAHLKSDTIAKAIGKTSRTIRRAIAKLIELGMIERLEFMRSVAGGNGANIYRIVHPSASTRTLPENTTTATAEATKKATEPITLKNNKPSNTTDTAKSQLSTESDVIKRGLLAKIPTDIAETLEIFFDASAIHRLYGVMLRAKASINRLLTFESDEYEYNKALMSVLSAWKRGKVRSLDAVIYEATKRTARRLWLIDRGRATFNL